MSVTWKWLAGIALGVVLTIGGWVWKSTTENVLVLQKETREQAIEFRGIKTEQQWMRMQMERIEGKQDRMEAKLDRALEK